MTGLLTLYKHTCGNLVNIGFVYMLLGTLYRSMVYSHFIGHNKAITHGLLGAT